MAKRSAERTDFLANVLVTAVEGGVGYWSYARRYEWEEDDQDNLTSASVELAVIGDADDAREDGRKITWMPVDLDTIARGVRRILAKGFSSVRFESITFGSKENDAGAIDSDDADLIVQVGLFGEAVYG